MAIGLLYAIGLLIVNADLASFGLVSLDLARPEYVLAGVLWAFLSVLSPLIGLLVPRLSTRRVPPRQVLLLSIVTSLVFGIAIPVMMTGVATGLPSTPSTIRHLVIGVGINCLTMVVAAYFVALLREGWLSDAVHSQSAGRTFVLLSGALVGVLLLVVNLTSYAILLYPEFPKKFGGGRKPRALVMLSESYPGHSGLPSSEDGRVIGPVVVLLETSSAVAVTGYEEIRVELQGVRHDISAVSIERKHISSLVYLKPTRQAK